MKPKIFLIYFLISLTSGNFILAQQNNAKATLGKKNILVGEQVKLRLECSFPKKAIINWPIVTDTITNGIEVINVSKFDTSAANKNNFITLGQTLAITSFDSGSYTIPPFQFSYSFKNDTALKLLSTDSLTLYVNYIPVDTTMEIKAIKEPLDSPYTWREIMPWVYGIAGLSVLALLIIYIIRRLIKRKPLLNFVNKKPLHPHEEALQELERLRTRNLWQQGKIKEYYTILTDVLRLYILRRYKIQAIEMTSEEIIDEIKNTDINDENIKILKSIFALSDLAKFAKGQPMPDENDRSMKNAVEFVNTTTPVIISVENKEVTNNGNLKENQK